MTQVKSFPPIAGSDTRVLVLGSMPGVRSLTAGQYYAHKQNAFWPIMARLLEFPPNASYTARIAALTSSGIALWDVLKSCYRVGSMDADIREADLVANDFDSFFSRHASVKAVFFNGAKAEQLWNRHAVAGLPVQRLPARCMRLPSTSPAYAAMRFEQKLAAWRAVVDCLRV